MRRVDAPRANSFYKGHAPRRAWPLGEPVSSTDRTAVDTVVGSTMLDRYQPCGQSSARRTPRLTSGDSSGMTAETDAIVAHPPDRHGRGAMRVIRVAEVDTVRIVDVPSESWLDARLAVRPSAFHGLGLVASGAIGTGEVVIRLGATR